MNSFFASIINSLRNIRFSIATTVNPSYRRNFVVGSIISGKYSQFKHDPNPTVLYMGTYFNPKKKKWYVHGFNLHYLDNFERNFIIQTIYMMKRGNQIVNPRNFYYYIKLNRPSIAKKCYRIYHAELCNYYTISPGFANINSTFCYSITDARDDFVRQLNGMINSSYNPFNRTNDQPSKVAYSQDELQQHITEVLNTHKII